MKSLLSFLLCIAVTSAVFSQKILPRPNSPRLVNDEAHVLSPEQVGILEERLVALDDSTSNQIAIVTIPTLDDYPIEDYAVALFRSWGIGTKKNNNGVLVLVAVNDHKMRIEVGYGLEGAIPDVIAHDIIDNDLAPNFRNGDYYRGFDEAITSLGKAAAGEYSEARKRKNDDGGGGSILVFIVVLFVVLMIVGRGRGGGRGGGGMVSRRGYNSLLWPLIFSNLGGGRQYERQHGDRDGESERSWRDRRKVHSSTSTRVP
ncbi:MAG TPA: TPM domain-containing protein [Panacibacter sp.]|nr:TPM domain-containing protein [Panacibacter sp.]